MNKVFFDSNVVLYLYSSDEILKRNRVLTLIDEFDTVYMSSQVLFEFCYVMVRKLKRHHGEIQEALEELRQSFEFFSIDQDILKHALDIAQKTKYSFPDSLSSAIKAGCNYLFSEDMHNEHIVENIIQIKNPFLEI